MAKVAKRLFFDIDGVGRVNAKTGATFNPGGSTRTVEKADTGVIGYSEEPMEPTLQFTLANDGTVGIDALRNLTNVNVAVQDDNGQTWIVSGCFVTEPPALTNGEISVSMSGVTADLVS